MLDPRWLKTDGATNGQVLKFVNGQIVWADDNEGSGGAGLSQADSLKLAGIEANAKDDQTGAEIVNAIDTELGQTDWKTSGGGGLSAADSTKLANIETNATADQTGTEIISAIDGQIGTTWKSGSGGGGGSSNFYTTADSILQNAFALGAVAYVGTRQYVIQSDSVSGWPVDSSVVQIPTTNGNYAVLQTQSNQTIFYEDSHNITLPASGFRTITTTSSGLKIANASSTENFPQSFITEILTPNFVLLQSGGIVKTSSYHSLPVNSNIYQTYTGNFSSTPDSIYQIKVGYTLDSTRINLVSPLVVQNATNDRPALETAVAIDPRTIASMQFLYLADTLAYEDVGASDLAEVDQDSIQRIGNIISASFTAVPVVSRTFEYTTDIGSPAFEISEDNNSQYRVNNVPTSTNEGVLFFVVRRNDYVNSFFDIIGNIDGGNIRVMRTQNDEVGYIKAGNAIQWNFNLTDTTEYKVFAIQIPNSATFTDCRLFTSTSELTPTLVQGSDSRVAYSATETIEFPSNGNSNPLQGFYKAFGFANTELTSSEIQGILKFLEDRFNI